MPGIAPRGSRIGAALVIATVAALSACSGSSTSSLPTAPSANPTSETFTGTVPVGGSDTHNFTVGQSNGQVNVTLTAAGPPATIYMGLGVGTPATDASCTLLTNASIVTPAGTTAQLTGTANAGTYCVVVYDVGNQVGDITYSVTVSHY